MRWRYLKTDGDIEIKNVKLECFGRCLVNLAYLHANLLIIKQYTEETEID